jgi:pimeloyl-ACP methyl ester carboxylesterase
MRSERAMVAVEDGELCVHVWPKPGAPRLLFAHANGFNGRTYRQFLEPLTDRFEVIAPDLRGHGLSTAATDPETHRNWHGYANDLCRVIESLDERPLAVAGHSMGAVASVLAAGRHDLPVAHIALIEPVIMPAFFYLAAHMPWGRVMMRQSPLHKGAIARRATWTDRESAAARYRQKRMFADWAPGVLEDYLEDGLRAAETGLELSCSPRWEAANFASHRHDVWGALKAISAPISVLKGARKDSTVYVAEALRRRGTHVETLAGAGHLAPLSHPAACADWVLGRTVDLA